MRETSLRSIKASNDYDWHVSQTFDKLGKSVIVQAWGFTRKDALHNFTEAVKDEASYRDVDPLQELYNILWNIAEVIDNIIRRIKS